MNMSTWRIASSRVTSEQATTGRTGRISSPPKHAPAGDIHAYRPGESHTACGRPVAMLKLWPARVFGRGPVVRRCRGCHEAAIVQAS